jgi:transcription termination/antitermination protein NusA
MKDESTVVFILHPSSFTHEELYAMKGSDLLRFVEQMHHEKNIDRKVIFDGIEAAVQLATEKHFGIEEDIVVTIDRESGEISARKGTEDIDPSTLGRIAVQSAKQVMIQKIREGECEAVYSEFTGMKGDLVTGTIQRIEGGAAIVSLGKTEAILPRMEQIPGEAHHVNERIKAVVLDVKKVGHRVKIILSRTHPEFVRRLFEIEIPEIGERIIEIKALSREAGYRTKIAVSSIDLKVDCVGACVGVRGSRIKNIVEELSGERIDIVRWNDSLQVMIPNALQPAQIEEVFLYPRLGRAIVLVKEDQLSLAIGRRGQNVRLASKLVGWDIEIMTHEELNEGIEKAETMFRELPFASDSMVEAFIEEGFLSYNELTYLEPAQLAELAGVSEEEAEEIIAFAEEAAEEMEAEEAAKPADSESRAVAAGARARTASKAADLLFAPEPAKVETPKPTMESLFGPDATVRSEEPPLSASQVFGETPAAPAQEQPQEAEEKQPES